MSAPRRRRRAPRAVMNEDVVNENKKAGSSIMISSFLAIIAAVFMSDGWIDQGTVFYNLLVSMRIQFFGDDNPMCLQFKSECNYIIDIPTKYIILILLAMAAYGLLVYLEIAPFRWRKRTTGAVSDAD